ncbi:hypothetical protein Plhal710r2_c082g0180671 [Plasmopara halstedii]
MVLLQFFCLDTLCPAFRRNHRDSECLRQFSCKLTLRVDVVDLPHCILHLLADTIELKPTCCIRAWNSALFANAIAP